MDDSPVVQVLKSRNVLREILGYKAAAPEAEAPEAPEEEEAEAEAGRNEYNFDENFDNIELEDLYDTDKRNFVVTHKDIPEWNLHVSYLKFPAKGDSTNINISKTSIENEIDAIYGKDTANKEDNIIIILPPNTSTAYSTYINYVDNVNMGIEKTGEVSDLEKEILKKYSKPDVLRSRHIHNIQIFHINALTVNILKHKMVPKHEIIRNDTEIEKILEEHNCSSKTQFPVIQKHDAVAEILGLVSGDMVKIHRASIASGKSVFYRICK